MINNKEDTVGLTNIDSALRSIDDKFEVVVATTDDEIRKLGTAGFQKYDERKIGGVSISYYRRPKRFSAYGS